jgi:hypothetical protein
LGELPKSDDVAGVVGIAADPALPVIAGLMFALSAREPLGPSVSADPAQPVSGATSINKAAPARTLITLAPNAVRFIAQLPSRMTTPHQRPRPKI